MSSLPTPYPHQRRTKTKVVASFRKLQAARALVNDTSAPAILVVSPCGSGKTYMFTDISGGAIDKGRKVLVLVHREELLDQAVASITRLKIECGIIKADRASNPRASIQVATVQTLHSQPQSLPPDIRIVHSDEAHHDEARTRKALIQRFSGLELLMGWTATPSRSDGRPMGLKSGGLYEDMIEAATVSELQRTPRDMDDPQSPPILVPFDYAGPSGYQDALFREPIDGIVEFGRRPDGSYRPAILFCASIPESEDAVRTAYMMGIRARHVDGKTNRHTRKRIFDDLREGKIDLLCNVDIATEGTDVPNCEVVGIARTVGNPALWIQMGMRAGRSSPGTGKQRGLIIDYRGWRHEHGLMESERIFSLEGTPILLADTHLSVRQCPKCGACFKPAPTCRACGHVFETDVKRQKVDRNAQPKATDALPDAAERKRYWFALRAVAKKRGLHMGWVKQRYKEKFGFPPGDLERIAS